MLVTYYAINFIHKLRHQARVKVIVHCSKNNQTQKTPKHLICSTHIVEEVELKPTLKTVDTHVEVNTDALLDNGATGLFIDCAFVHRNEIPMHMLEHPITVYNIDGTGSVEMT